MRLAEGAHRDGAGERVPEPGVPHAGLGGSTSVRAFMQPLRQAGAAAREMLKLAAAEALGRAGRGVPCRGRPGGAWPEGQIARYGELAAAAAALEPPAEPPLKAADPVPPDRPAGARLDLPDKVRGKAVFGIDVRVPDMVYATIRQSPVFGGKVREHRQSSRGRAGAACSPWCRSTMRSRSWPSTSGRRRRRPMPSRSPGTRVPAPASTMRRSWRCSAPRSTARGGRDGARRRRSGARRRGQGGRGGVRAAVPRARHHGADERDRARHGDAGRDLGAGRARDRSPARWRRCSSYRPRRSSSTPRSSAAASAGGSSSTSRSRRRGSPGRSASRR